jgi:NAD(P)H dehydrogenase (quinone)
MNVGIIVHSQSGHTAHFAKAIADQLRENGHEVDLKLLRPTGAARPLAKNISLRSVPDPAEYDTLLLGGPVWGFSASPVCLAYLEKIDSLKKKITLPFVTMGFPFKPLGGVKAIRKLESRLAILGADVREGEILKWTFKPSDEKIVSAAKRICGRLKRDSGVGPG